MTDREAGLKFAAKLRRWAREAEKAHQRKLGMTPAELRELADKNETHARSLP